MAALMLCLAGVALADDLQTVGDPDSLGFSARRLARMTSWFEAQSEKGDPSGFVVGIARGGKLAYLQATGFEDLDKKMPMRPDSIFRIGSMSKQITSVATMILVDEGKLDLDAPVAQYLPELRDMQVVKKDPVTGAPILSDVAQNIFEPAKRAMTIRDLLRNTSGLVYVSPDYADPGFENAAIHVLYGARAPFRRDKPIADFVASLGALPLLHQPGEVWEYAIGYDVLGRVIEVVSGQPFDQFLQSRLFAPLHMVDSGFSVPQDKLARLVAVPGPQPQPPFANSDVGKPQTFFSGGGGIVSTVPDFLRFCQMLLNGGELDGVRILKPETVRLMTTNSLPPEMHIAGHEVGPAFGTGWGLGFAVRTSPDFSYIPGALGSFNWQGSWGTFFSIDPAQKLILIMMMQRSEHSENGFYFDAIRRLPYAALNVPEAPAPVASGQGNAGALAEYVGRYVFGGSASSLDRQTSIPDGNGWTGLEFRYRGHRWPQGDQIGRHRPCRESRRHGGRSHHSDRRQVDQGPDLGGGLSSDFRSGQRRDQVRDHPRDAERSARCCLCPGGGSCAECRASSQCRRRQARRRGNRRLVNPRFRQGSADALGGSLEG